MPKQRCEIIRERDGTTSMEYAIMVAVIAALLISGVINYGGVVASYFSLASHITLPG